jgi:hypothetical protein
MLLRFSLLFIVVMLITNNKENVRYLFYTVGGLPKSVKFGPLESIEVSDLESEEQIIYNSLDYKLKGINERFGTDFEVDFTVANSSSVSVLDSWYASLLVKPSAGLWTDLKAMADGMNSDGDWNEMDMFGMLACMETDEQRLKPLKTTSLSDFTKVGNPTLNSAGALNPVPGAFNYIRTNWTPSIHGVKFTQNSASFSIYADTNNNPFTLGGVAGAYSFNFSTNLVMNMAELNTTLSNGGSSINDDASGEYAVLKTGFTNSSKRYFSSLIRTTSNLVQSYLNGQSSALVTSVSNGRCDINLALLGYDDGSGYVDTAITDIIRVVITGSGNVNPDRVATRLNSFFTSRGLTITNY